MKKAFMIATLVTILSGVIILYQNFNAKKYTVNDAPSVKQGDITITDDAEVLPEKNTPQGELPEAAPVKQVDYAPDFRLSALDGSGEISLSDYRGVKPVILDFFAPHCPNCRRNIKAQVPLYEKYKDRIEVILVTGIDREPMNTKYFSQNPVPMPIVYDDTDQALKDYGIRFTNTHVLINKEGAVEEVVFGDIREDHFQSLLHY